MGQSYNNELHNHSHKEKSTMLPQAKTRISEKPSHYYICSRITM